MKRLRLSITYIARDAEGSPTTPAPVTSYRHGAFMGLPEDQNITKETCRREVKTTVGGRTVKVDGSEDGTGVILLTRAFG